MTDSFDLAIAERFSLNPSAPANIGGIGADNLGGLSGMFFIRQVSDIAPAWNTYRRAFFLRELAYHPHNGFVMGIIRNLQREFKQTPHELIGGRNLTRQWQHILQFIDIGDGWDDFSDKWTFDYLTQDNGAWWYLLAKGEPDTPLDSRVENIEVLDSIRCYPTGQREYPVYYLSPETNKYHRIHWSRVIRHVDMPSSNPMVRGMGYCALSRALASAHTDVLMSKYHSEKLNDLPPSGLMTVSGMSMTQWRQAVLEYEANRQTDGQTTFRNALVLTGADASVTPKVDITPFANLPDGFNYREYIDIEVNRLAVQIGVDPQDIWPLSGGQFGTGEQSRILAAKGKAKTIGDLFSITERVMNIRVLPRELEFEFKHKDTEQAKSEAETARSWGFLVSNLMGSGILMVTEARQLLANTVTAYRDVLLDENGQLRLPDDDPMTEEQETQTNPNADITLAPMQAQQVVTSSDGEAPVTIAEDDSTLKAQKDIQSTRLDFEGDFEDFLSRAISEQMDRRRAGTIMRALVTKYGRAAYADGLAMGGVEMADASNEDLAAIASLARDQSTYVTNFLSTVYSEDGLPTGLVGSKPELWWNKSISPFYTAGLMSGDRNGMYEWSYGDTEHCDDCQRLNGQRHRMREWLNSGWIPKSSKLACKGYRCKCEFNKSSGRARGNY